MVVRYSFTEQSKFLILRTVFRKSILQEEERVAISLESMFKWIESVPKQLPFKAWGCTDWLAFRHVFTEQVVIDWLDSFKTNSGDLFTMAI